MCECKQGGTRNLAESRWLLAAHHASYRDNVTPTTQPPTLDAHQLPWGNLKPGGCYAYVEASLKSE